MAEKWHVGNANIDGERTRGWLLGHFIGEDGDPRSTTAVEVKWGVHPAGEGRDGWVTDEQRTTLLILVRGRFRLDLSVASTTLEKEGDYAVWVQESTIPGRPRRTPSSSPCDGPRSAPPDVQGPGVLRWPQAKRAYHRDGSS